MIYSEQQQPNQNRRRRRHRTAASASAVAVTMPLSSTNTNNPSTSNSGGVCATTWLAFLLMIVVPMEMTLASPYTRAGFSPRIRSILSCRPNTLLHQRRDLFSNSMPLSLRSAAVRNKDKPVTTSRAQKAKATSAASLNDPLEEELRELDALYGDDDHRESTAISSESAYFRPTLAQDVARLRQVSFSYTLHKRSKYHDDDSSALGIPETELELLESSSSSSRSRPKGRFGVPQTMLASRTTVVSTASPVGAAGAAAATTSCSKSLTSETAARGGSSNIVAANAAATAKTASSTTRPLQFWESMVCGAISRSMAQTLLHPANAMKTILQNSRTESVSSLMKLSAFPRLTKGAGANFLLSVPHGAVNFAVLEFVRRRLGAIVAANPALQERSGRLGPTLDFASSAISTIVCSVVSTPQMMITDNIMAGNFNNLPAAVTGLANRGGVWAFYRGWWPGLVGKIPSYALTWTLFQELKLIRDRITHHRPATNIENAFMGCMASATTVTIMIPLDTIKTRLVTQGGSAVGSRVYKGIIDCAVRVAREEGMSTFYRGLPPRLASVVPMIGIQFGVYEFMKKVMLRRTGDAMPVKRKVGSDKEEKAAPVVPSASEEYDASQVFEEAAMEVAASPEQPYPAPQFLKRVYKKTLEQTQKTLLEQTPTPWQKVLKLQR